MKAQEFKRLKKALKNMIPDVTVRISRKPFKRPHLVGVGGYYSCSKKLINISIRGNQSYTNVLAVLANAVRHAVQDKEGLFRAYYDPRLEDKQYLQTMHLGELCSDDLAMEAENDCNAFARYFLSSHGYEIPETSQWGRDFYRPCHVFNTMTYQIRRYVNHQRRPA